MKTTFEKKLKQKILIFYLKDFIFYKYICKMYKLNNDLQLKIVENKDLYRRFLIFFLTKSSYISI